MPLFVPFGSDWFLDIPCMFGAKRAYFLGQKNNWGKSMSPLTDESISAIKPSGKITRHHDSQGLYLEVTMAGGKYWRWKYRFEHKEKRLSFGAWPKVSLQYAREMRDKARAILLDGIDPSHQYKMNCRREKLETDSLRRKAKIINRIHEIDLEVMRLSALQAEKQSLEAELAILDKTLNEVSLWPLP